MLGIIFSLSVVLLWIVVSVGTVRGAFVTGTLLFVPCAAEYERAFDFKEAEKKEQLRNGASAVWDGILFPPLICSAILHLVNGDLALP